MALIDLDKFVASFITEMKECSQMRNFSIPRCIKKALDDQGLEYKDGEIIKTQRRVSAEAKEAGYGEPEDEKIRQELIKVATLAFRRGDTLFGEKWDYMKWITWLEKQGTSYTKRDVEDAYVEGMAFAKNELEKQGKQILANSAKTCKDEQKPTWSEDDETGWTNTMIMIKECASFHYTRKSVKLVIDWLNSIKQRIGG